MRLPAALPLVRALGIVEIAVAVPAAITFARPLLVLLAAMYLAFAAFVTAALGAKAPLQSCGCFGQVDTPPSPLHVGLNLAAAGASLAAALTGTPGLDTTLSDQPWGGAPFVLLAGISVWLCVLVATVLPLTSGSGERA
jgi:hypothetical protein